MARRTQLFPIIPWEGGLNLAMDSAMIPATDLVIADNIVFNSNNARKKRSGRSYLDTNIPSVISRSSSGTTRTLVFASSINISSPLDQILVVGEKITITSTGSGNDLTYAATDVAIASIGTTTLTNDTITYTDTGSLAESDTATTTLIVKRSSSILAIEDLWYYDSATKAQRLCYGTTQGLFFFLDSNGRRKQIIKEATAVDTFVDADVNTGSDSITLNAHTLKQGYKIRFTTSGTLPAGLSLATDYFVIYVDANTIKLASSYDNAFNEIPVDITAAAGGGTHTLTSFASTAITGPLTTMQMLTYNNKLIISMNATGNTPKMYDPLVADEWIDLPGEPPDFEFMREHQGRLFTNEKTNLDRLHYSETFSHWIWNGFGDSGALDTSVGDGDPSGLRAISPSFKGELHLFKKSKTGRLVGTTPEDYLIVPVSDGLGTESNQSFCNIDQDDLFYVSPRGVHSLATTDRFGSFESKYISRDIQPRFNTFNKAALKTCKSVWIPNLNSVAFLFTESDATKSIYLINVNNPEQLRWYRWPEVNATTMSAYELENERILILGTDDSRIVRTQNGELFDYTNTPIIYRIKSGTIYPNNDPISYKAFLRLSLMYRPVGNFNALLTCKIDNFSNQAYNFNQISGTDLLGSTFVLGESSLGITQTMAPYTTTIEGYGRGIILEIEQSGVEEDLDLYGFVIEWESADLLQEVVTS